MNNEIIKEFGKFIGMGIVVLAFLWLRGDIKGVFPSGKYERHRTLWVMIAAINFILFIIHVRINGASAFPGGGRLKDGVFLVSSHGQLVTFKPLNYYTSIP